MDNNAITLENLNFAELKPSTEKNERATWAEKSTTLYAHPSGKLPSRFADAVTQNSRRLHEACFEPCEGALSLSQGTQTIH